MGFEIFGKLGLDTSDFTAGFRRASKETESFQMTMGKQLGGFAALVKSQLAGAFTGIGLIAATKQVVDYGGRIADMSKRVEVGTDAIQEFEHAARLSGASLEDVGAAFRGLARARNDALDGDDGKLTAFSNFGLDKAALQAQSLEQIFRRIAQTFGTTDFGADELALIMEVLGRSGDSLLPAFKNGFMEAADEARNLGLVINGEVIDALDKAGDEWETLVKRMREPFAEFLSFATKGVTALADGIEFLLGVPIAFWQGFVQTEGNLKEKFKGAVDFQKAFMDNMNDRFTAPENGVDPAREQRVAARVEEEKKIQREAKTMIARERSIPFFTDSIQQIGGLSSGAGFGDPRVGLERDQLEVLKRIETNTSESTKGTRAWP